MQRNSGNGTIRSDRDATYDDMLSGKAKYSVSLIIHIKLGRYRAIGWLVDGAAIMNQVMLMGNLTDLIPEQW